MLEKFIDATLKPVLIIGGIGTALAGANAFFPQWATENVQNIEWIQTYTIFVQHWGIMVCLMGICMVAAAYKETWRGPIILYGLLEKIFMVFLVVSNMNEGFAEGFYIPAMMDTILSIYFILYFLSLRKNGE